MKKTIILSAVILLAAIQTVKAQQESTKYLMQNSIKTVSSFSKVVIGDDIDVILTESPDQRVIIEGHPKNTGHVKWTIKNNTLYLRSKYGSLKGKVVAVIGVHELRDLEVKGNSYVKSLGTLNSPMIKVQLYGDGMVALQNNGRIHVASNDGTDIEVRKQTGRISIESK